MPLIETPSFERWITHAFAHPEDDPTWHRRRGCEHWGGESSLKAEFIARTFEHAADHLAPFSDRQIEAGLWMILGEGYASEALGDAVPLEARLRLVRSTFDLFSSLFAARCREMDWAGAAPLYCICYMFWEIFPLDDHPIDPQDTPVCAEKIAVLEKILAVKNSMCQYSALHGLGHARRSVPERVVEIIDRWSARNTEADARLLAYAQDARKGDVQ